MSDIKLPKLPDRTPVKLTVTISAELNQWLKDYSDLYHATYGNKEPIQDLIPYMLEIFLQSDKAFLRPAKSRG